VCKCFQAYVADAESFVFLRVFIDVRNPFGLAYISGLAKLLRRASSRGNFTKPAARCVQLGPVCKNEKVREI